MTDISAIGPKELIKIQVLNKQLKTCCSVCVKKLCDIFKYLSLGSVSPAALLP